ncbi:PP2C family serine/threonine-protein phosphatase [Pantoea sp. 1.19]|uniref:PP2C family protein-serine/threonine phosphatase n=1 Tax=Pantoea sp. 1.19 TaxID=1925589 RepID=UPI0009489C56|nr:PP2C family serine/threonine-protein phosphatase [Pantoea sp. 1.19]
MNITWAADSLQGLRDSNQDLTGARLDADSGCFLVCDGVAGTPGGDLAAGIARQVLLAPAAGEERFSPQQTRQRVVQADARIRQCQRRSPQHAQMSTTLAALFIDRHQQQAWWAHAGDSRLYHFRRGELCQVTRDHSLAQQLREAGLEVSDRSRHLLVNALGAQPPREASYSGLLSLEDGDAFLLCTDGFWQQLTPADMVQTLHGVSSPQAWLTRMLQASAASPPRDNLSALAVWIGAPQAVALRPLPGAAAHSLPSQH